MLASTIKRYLGWAFVLLLSLATHAQKVTYSEPDKDDSRSLDYEIIGKFNQQFLIYKTYREQHFISVYDQQMKLTNKVKLNFLPDRIINADFLAYPEHCYMFYQYQKKNIVYSMAVKIGVDGQKVGDPVQLDTTAIGFFASNKMYAVINSENKEKIMTYKVDSRNERNHIITSVLFDKDLNLINKSRLSMDMSERNDFLTDFQLDNEGDLAFLKATGTSQSDNINKLKLYIKPAKENNFSFYEINTNKLYLDELFVKIDNYNHRFLVTSFYSKQKRGNVEGLFCYLWDKKTANVLYNTATIFSDELRADARGESSTKTAFNDYYIRNLIIRDDGGFIVSAESAYTTSRGNANSRWDYWNYSSMYNPAYNGFYTYSPYSYYTYPWSRGSSFNVNRYYSDNIAVISYDDSAKLEWSNVIRKSQYDDNTDNFIGHTLANTGENLFYLFNLEEKRTLILNVQTVSPEGQISRNPTPKNLDKGYEFMPRFAKQVGSRQIIMPCQYRNYICFAKIDL